MKGLLVQVTTGKGRKIRLEGSVFAVGRTAPSFADFRAEDLATVSVRHAQFFEESNHIYLLDLGSKSGTKVNDSLLEDHPVRLRSGDVITFGALTFRVDTGGSPLQEKLAATEILTVDGDATEILDQGSSGGQAAPEPAPDPGELTAMAQSATEPVAPAEADAGDATQVLGAQSLDENTVLLQEPGSADPAMDATLIHAAQPSRSTAVTSPVKDASRRWGARGLWGAGAFVLVALVLISILSRDPSPVADGGQVPADAARVAAEVVVSSAFAENDLDLLPARLFSVFEAHGGGGEVRRLLDDATRYRELIYRLDSRQYRVLANLRGTGDFNSAIFEDAATGEIDSLMRPGSRVARELAATDAWREGDLVTALDVLMQLGSEPGGAGAPSRLAHYRRVVQDYETLNALSGSASYPGALLAFYLGLDPLDDPFFWRRLASDAERAAQPEILAAASQLEKAAITWANYHSSGRIDGQMRQQSPIGTAFRQRSRELKTTSAVIADMLQLMGELRGGGTGTSALLFPRLVAAEITWQRSRLALLQSHSPNPVFTEKLRILPQAASAAPGLTDDLLTESP